MKNKGSSWEKYNDGFTLSGEGTSVVEYYPVDEAGNIEVMNLKKLD